MAVIVVVRRGHRAVRLQGVRPPTAPAHCGICPTLRRCIWPGPGSTLCAQRMSFCYKPISAQAQRACAATPHQLRRPAGPGSAAASADAPGRSAPRSPRGRSIAAFGLRLDLEPQGSASGSGEGGPQPWPPRRTLAKTAHPRETKPLLSRGFARYTTRNLRLGVIPARARREGGPTAHEIQLAIGVRYCHEARCHRGRQSVRVRGPGNSRGRGSRRTSM